LRRSAQKHRSRESDLIDAGKVKLHGLGQKRGLTSAKSSDFYRKLLRISDCAATFTSEVRRMSDDGTLSREPKLKLVAGGGVRTLEDVIRELLQPILQGWLDDKLPEIIERLVRSEIARVLNSVAA
jgi:Protein of unknown function (DUF2497)